MSDLIALLHHAQTKANDTHSRQALCVGPDGRLRIEEASLAQRLNRTICEICRPLVDAWEPVAQQSRTYPPRMRIQ